MYAVVAFQGFQYRVSPDDRIQVPCYKAEVGDSVTLSDVLLVGGGDEVLIGRPTVAGAHVAAEVVSHLRGKKIIVAKYKKRKAYRRRNGYRSDLTELRILDINVGSGRVAKPIAKETEGGE
ncbi:MAG: 50S ribosomal protein L21 [Candidatus Eisenbacteria bacterium]|uniref:Large ribosomal subunit protein bL21 n=1 Tax=Eiseniibacteriota bacterium TaxID=2212470 RepID=A0A948RUJ1_UNCEI|nr:50S ribosomal protein L21 [Candidatus Eisenbacteria bacterium]MBU1947932.1 50S ribosomal protein L21 [Candidatus Eisenbacteria bacterium]MBU2689818.1 50S ribosomal protein L21 [Candidatus Eisenbacteria bacterium]